MASLNAGAPFFWSNMKKRKLPIDMFLRVAQLIMTLPGVAKAISELINMFKRSKDKASKLVKRLTDKASGR